MAKISNTALSQISDDSANVVPYKQAVLHGASVWRPGLTWVASEYGVEDVSVMTWLPNTAPALKGCSFRLSEAPWGTIEGLITPTEGTHTGSWHRSIADGG